MIKAERTLNAHLSTLNFCLSVRLGFRKTDYFAAFFPLAALFEQLDPLKTLQNVALGDDGAGSSEAAMLRHKLKTSAQASAKLTIFKHQMRGDYNWLVRTTCCPEAVTW